LSGERAVVYGAVQMHCMRGADLGLDPLSMHIDNASVELIRPPTTGVVQR